MNYKKILVTLLIIATLCVTLTAITAVSTQKVDIGDITKSTLTENGQDSQTSKLNFTANIEIDISDLSALEKEELKKAIDNKNDTVFILNLTAGNINVSMQNFQGSYDANIKGNTLYVEYTNVFDSLGIPVSDFNVTEVSFKTDEKLFTTLYS